MNIQFLPPTYETPKTNNFYAKLLDGENRFRILSQPIIGWEDWLDKKPVRFRMNEKPDRPADPKKPFKHFWSMIVWNYNEQQIQILHLTQTSIRKSIEALCRDTDWGAPYFYDLKIFRSGDGMDTEYVVNPIPHKPISDSIKAAFYDRRCNLEALFDNADPFDPFSVNHTEGIFSEDQVKVKSETINANQAYDLICILNDCDKEYKEKFYENLWNKYKTYDIQMISPFDFQTIFDSAKAHLKDQVKKSIFDNDNAPLMVSHEC